MENTDILNDVSNMSIHNSFLLKNKIDLKMNQGNSMEDDRVPCFGQSDSGVTTERIMQQQVIIQQQ